MLEESGIHKQYRLWNTKFWALESEIQLKESGIPQTIGIPNPSYSKKNQESSTLNPGINGVESRIQDCLGPSWIPSHGATRKS